jgi:glutamine phosphoribosylpyrophosphate amidotransferase
MSGFFGVTSKTSCIEDVFYGTDYHSHLGTKRGGMVFIVPGKGFRRSIHNLENSYFRNKFEDELTGFTGNSGLGVISDTDPQPILFNSHLGHFAIVTVSRIVNILDLESRFLENKKHFTENFEGSINPTEVVANLICEKDSFITGIENVFENIKGSCSILILTDNGIIAARDKLGRTPVVIGKKEKAYAVASESCSFPNTGFELNYFLGPGEIVHINADGFSQLRKPGKKMVFLDDSIVRGTQLKNNTIDLRESGASEVHMRIACPPLLFACNFLNFSESRSTLELAGRKAISQLGGEEKDLQEYANPDSSKYSDMVQKVAGNLNLDSLIYQRLDDLVTAIGLPKEKLCTHCWDGTSYY